MKADVWSIYVLCDPTTVEIRYVGVTNVSTRTRLSEHISTAKRERNHRACWIRSLLKNGLRPTIVAIETGSGEGWQECERAWIKRMRDAGVRLTNATDGGEGTLGWKPNEAQRAAIGERTRRFHTGRKHSAEARARMSAGQLRAVERERLAGAPRRGCFVRTPETLAKMSAAQMGHRASEETRRKLSEAHSNPSLETREKLRQAIFRRPVEQREAFASNQKGKPKSAEHRLKIAQAHLGRPKHTEESKLKLRLANLGKKRSEESVRKNAEACRKAWQKKREEGRAFGHRHTEESKQKLRLANLGKKRSEESVRKWVEAFKRNRAEKRENAVRA